MKIKFMVHNIADDIFFFLHPHFHHCLGAFSSISASYKIRWLQVLWTRHFFCFSSSTQPREDAYVIKTVAKKREKRKKNIEGWYQGKSTSVIHKALTRKKGQSFNDSFPIKITHKKLFRYCLRRLPRLYVPVIIAGAHIHRRLISSQKRISVIFLGVFD